MSNQNYTNHNHPGAKMREVSLPRLLLLTFRWWRSMLAAGLVLAILLAGLKVVCPMRHMRNTWHRWQSMMHLSRHILLP